MKNDMQMQCNFTAVNTDCSVIFAIFGSVNHQLDNTKCIARQLISAITKNLEMVPLIFFKYHSQFILSFIHVYI
jgi:hypothetical protein